MIDEPSDSRNLSESVQVARVLARLSDRYAVDRRIGKGGMGVVYLARDVRLGRPVATKVLHPEVSHRLNTATFQREIRTMAALQHPHILPVLDSGSTDGVFFYIMPYLAEGSVHDLLENSASLPVDRAIRIAVDVLEALEHAHSRGVVHCDLKPENILLSNNHAILADFGISRSATATVSKNRVRVFGSPTYMSPEQAAGDERIDGRSDVFSLACVLYEMLSGAPAFTGPHDLAIIASRFRGAAPNLSAVRPAVPRGIAQVVSRALSVDPGGRYQSAAGFAAALCDSSERREIGWKKRSVWRQSLGRTI